MTVNLSIDQQVYVMAGIVRGCTVRSTVCIKQARVKWVDRLEFGVAFGLLDDRAADDLQQLLGELLHSESYSEFPVHM